MDNKKYYDEYISRNFDRFAVCKKSLKKRVFIDMDGVLCEYRPEAKITDMKSSLSKNGLKGNSISLSPFLTAQLPKTDISHQHHIS